MSETGTTRTGVIAAMEREVRALVRNWKHRTIEHAGRRYRLYENGDSALICGGIGSDAARRATEALISDVKPARVLSVGFAGALDRSMQVGDVLTPGMVINAADGARIEARLGQGALVSSPTVADKDQKIRLAKAYSAIAVDMEAAAVAQGAQARGIEFAAVKVISDAFDFNMPALDHFVANDGTFRSARFAAYVAVRPWLWKSTLALAQNSSKASRALCAVLADYLERESGRVSGGKVSIVKSLRIEPLEGEDSNQESLKFASAHTSSGLGAHTQVAENNKLK
jgi:adenosylhomocysteine nucleosidase